VKLAYIVSAYRSATQLSRLVRALSTDSTAFFIHVDRRTSDSTFDAMRRGACDVPSVTFLDRHRSPWGRFGHVRASLKGIRAVLESSSRFDYGILLTGQDYPIKSNAAIAEFFERAAGRSFMQSGALPLDAWVDEHGGFDRLKRWHLPPWGKPLVTLPIGAPRRIPGGLSPFGGTSYWNLSRDCLSYVDTFVTNNPRFVRFFRSVRVPDELFFHTILLNSPLAGTIVNDDLRYVRWHPRGPVLLGTSDLHELRATPALFARKFDPDADPGILELLDTEVR
jgi:PAS domain-containing protein